MNRSILVSMAILAIVIGPATAVFGQAPVDEGWTAPRTPWGDPDIQGSFTNQSENGTPMERPAEFEGRELTDIAGEELAELKQSIENRTVERFAGPLHAPDSWWQPDLNLVDGSQAWLIVDPPDGKIPPLTPQAEERAAARAEARRNSNRGPADSWTDRSLYDRCISRGLPGSMMPAIYGNSYQIVQAPGFVAISYEMIHEMRVIPIDAGPHLSTSLPSYMGDARGHWEGDTLVVETTNFKEGSTYRNANHETLRLIERFKRISPDKVQWSVTIDDPDTWVRPWTLTMPLTVEGNQPVLEYSCHEGNRGLMNILSAARAEEREAAEAAAGGRQ